ncbi:MAG: inositol monophosphatase family protein [Candidatus Aenigmarchaeota archaeon]|nr:inositol monophosphatase family protein [Candidatus Aenigmarchaeota archaeon]MDI6722692.1 inositol monophosphatase family protein [Candidatus Aenigmarchaeota archaeon]
MRTLIKEIVINTVERSGRIAMDRINYLGKIKYKSQKDLVSDVDEEVEKYMRETFRRYIPDASFYGEEGGMHGKGKYLIAADPIDATTNYIRGIPLFDISVSVYEDDQIILGVISCPRLGELFVAEKGYGAYLNGECIHVGSTDDISKAMIGWNRSNHPPERESFHR